MRNSGFPRPAQPLPDSEDLPFALPLDPLPEAILIPTVLPVLRVIPVAEPARDHRPGVWAAIGRVLRWLGSVWEWSFGVLVLIVGLATLSAIPILQFLTLGYLLEAGGRIGRTGRLRDGFIGPRVAAQVGSVFLGAWLVLWPLRLVSSLALSAELIEPGGSVARGWKVFLIVLTVLVAVHIALACARGGRLRYFLWPLGNPLWLVLRLWRGGYAAGARDAVWDCVTSLRLPYYFWLGLRGFVGAFLWLAVPVTLLAVGRKLPALGFLGWLLLVIVLLYVPFLQIHFAAQNRFRALFEVGAVRAHYRRAPWAFACAFLTTLLFAVPLYLLKIEMIPREAAWLPSLVFIVFMFPTRLLTGWAYGRAAARPLPRHWFFRWTGRLGMLGVASLYALVVYFTQYVAWGGIWSLYEQHAFLLPVPFFSM